MSERFQGWKFGYGGRITGFDIPEVVRVTIGKDDEPTVRLLRIGSGLFLGIERMCGFPLRFYDNNRMAFVIKEEIVDEALGFFFKIIPQLYRVSSW